MKYELIYSHSSCRTRQASEFSDGSSSSLTSSCAGTAQFTRSGTGPPFLGLHRPLRRLPCGSGTSVPWDRILPAQLDPYLRKRLPLPWEAAELLREGADRWKASDARGRPPGRGRENSNLSQAHVPDCHRSDSLVRSRNWFVFIEETVKTG